MTLLTPVQDYREWGRLCIISPHLDDAVLSCGHLIACSPGAVIITILAGDAPSRTMQTPWDRLCGHDNAGKAMRARRSEDQTAAEILGATTKHLGFADGQYGEPAALADIASAMSDALSTIQIDTLLVPLGLHHSDHLHVAAAWRDTDFACMARRWIGYEEVPYRHIGSSVQNALARLERRNIDAVPVRWLGDPIHDERAVQRKARAITAYASQLHALPSDWLEDATTAETFWQLQAFGR